MNEKSNPDNPDNLERHRFLPPGGKDSDGRAVAVELAGTDGVDDGVLGDGGRAEAREGGGIAVAERDRGAAVAGVEIGHELAEDAADGDRRRRGQPLVAPELPDRRPVLHARPLRRRRRRRRPLPGDGKMETDESVLVFLVCLGCSGCCRGGPYKKIPRASDADKAPSFCELRVADRILSYSCTLVSDVRGCRTKRIIE